MNQKLPSYRFHHQVKTNYGEAVYVVGNIEMLGKWDLLQGLRLNWSKDDNWDLEVDFDRSQGFEYKYYISTYNNPTSDYIEWEKGTNRKQPALETTLRG